MVIAELSVVPVGTGEVSLSRYVAKCVKALRAANLSPRLTPMGTVVEGTLEEVLGAVAIVHQTPFAFGVKRVVTRVVLDERRDREGSAEQKLRSVQEKLGPDPA